MLRDLFEKDPCRDIVSVVKVDDHTPEIVWTELEEYVPTEDVKDSFRRIVEGFIETKSGYTEEVCVWLSGFFGSGKSHFLKVLGYLLENRELTTPDGRTIQSTSYIATKLGLQNFAPLLSKEFKTKVLPLYLLDYDHAGDPTLSRLIYKTLMRERGFSDTIWVSSWEDELRKEGKYGEFVDWVTKEFESDWAEKRKLHADVILKKALPLFLPIYTNEEDVGRAIEESKRVEITPSDVIKKYKGYAEEIDETKGRIVLLLDEAGLYVDSDTTERLTDLNALAEQVVKEGEGKVWLITTSQEALPDMVDRFAMERQKLEWLRDRFRHFSLTPAGVEKVVSERMLKKRVEAI
jgi:energy-coupling factor transporter ATP-binding protein EcfA2